MVLADFSLTIQAGEKVVLLGPNGCGKSTLIKTINRELYPQPLPESSMTILGRERWDLAELRSVLGIVANDQLDHARRSITGEEIVLSGFFSSMGLWPHHHPTEAMRARCAEILELLDATRLAKLRVLELSSGEARRLLIARALVHKPMTLLLDEPSTSLDIAAQKELRQTMSQLAQAGTGIILVTHHLPDIVPEIDRVVMLKKGCIVADGRKPELLRPETLSELFGRKVELMEREGFYYMW
jgi:iron complex transport system ATP-binding protein